MDNDLCVVNLPGQENYAIISPHRITYGLDASKSEFCDLMNEEKQITKDAKSKSEDNDEGKTIFDSIGLIPTFDCNSRCIYCYSSGGETKTTMTLEMSKSAIEAVNSQHSDHIDIYLVGGGEPLLPFELVCNIITFARSLYKSIGVHVVTNGVFGTETLNWLVKNNIDIRVSYDGLMHNIQRPLANRNIGISSREIVKENIKDLIANNLSVTVQCIITSSGLQNLQQIVDEIIEMGVGILKLEPALNTDISRGTKEMEPNPIEYAKALINVIEYVAELNVNIKIDTGYFTEPSDTYYCGVAKYNKIITPDGLVTACVEVAKATDPYADPIIFGRLEKKRIIIDEKRFKTLQSLHYKNQNNCAKCNLRFICQGGCSMASIWRYGFPLKNSSFTCILEHELIPQLLLKIAQNPKLAEIIFNDNVHFKTC